MSLRRIEFARWVALTTGRTTLLGPCCCTAIEELLPVLGMVFLLAMHRLVPRQAGADFQRDVCHLGSQPDAPPIR